MAGNRHYEAEIEEIDLRTSRAGETLCNIATIDRCVPLLVHAGVGQCWKTKYSTIMRGERSLANSAGARAGEAAVQGHLSV